MCADAKTNRVSFLSPYINAIEQLLDKLWRRIQDRSEFSTASGCSPLRMDVDSQERCTALHAFG